METEESGTKILVYYRDEMNLTAARVLETSQNPLPYLTGSLALIPMIR